MRSSPGPRLGQGNVELPKLCGWKGCAEPVQRGRIRCAAHELKVERPSHPPRKVREQIAPAELRPQVRDIVEAVSREFGGVPICEIRSMRKTRTIALARMVSMYCARMTTFMSLEEISLQFGAREHTATIRAVKKIGRLLLSGDAGVRRAVDAGMAAGTSWMGEAGKAAE